jgi:hypothetical protein
MNKIIILIITLFMQCGMLYAQSITDDERFANWTDEQYQYMSYKLSLSLPKNHHCS